MHDIDDQQPRDSVAPIATRVFTMDDQEWFATLSGDVNPMHLDPIAARRTQAGAPVVHGVHLMLWAIEAWLASCLTGKIGRIGRIAATFTRFVEVGNTVALTVRTMASAMKLDVVVGGTTMVTVTIRDQQGLNGEGIAVQDHAPFTHEIPPDPLNLTLDDLPSKEGALKLRDAAFGWPLLAGVIGSEGVDGLVMLSALVGMEAPGLHSIFSSLDVSFFATGHATGRLQYRVVTTHDVFRLVAIEVTSGHFAGNVRAFVRHPPVAQPAMSAIRWRVSPQDYANVSALVVGGSRGLGELTAKVLAAGGARVAITYMVGESDAARVAADISTIAGECFVFRYDATAPAGSQLDNLPFEPTHVYYFATGRIGVNTKAYSATLLSSFMKIYVDGFAKLCATLAATTNGRFACFYPSTVFVEEQPEGMTEYAMAKAAGEILCRSLDRMTPRMTVVSRRLPRLLTDQTATVTPLDMQDALTVVLHTVQEMKNKIRRHD